MAEVASRPAASVSGNPAERVAALRALAYSPADRADRVPPPREWLVPGLVPLREVTLMTGDGGSGKSTLVDQLGVSVATGTPWLGFDIKQGRALILSAEDDGDELERRTDEIGRSHGLRRADMLGLKFWPFVDADGEIALAFADSQRQLSWTDAWVALENEVAEFRPTLIVIDASADFFGGEEINRAHVRQFIANLRRLGASVGAAVVLIAHPSVAGINSGSGLSGSTAWNNSVRSRLYLKPDDAKVQNPEVRILEHAKANYGPRVQPLKLQRVAGGFRRLSGGAALTTSERRADDNRVEGVFLQLLDALREAGIDLSNKPGRNFAPKIMADDPRAQEAGVGSRALAKAMASLFAKKEIKVERVGPPSRQKAVLARIDPG